MQTVKIDDCELNDEIADAVRGAILIGRQSSLWLYTHRDDSCARCINLTRRLVFQNRS